MSKNTQQRISNKINNKNFTKNSSYLLCSTDEELVIDHVIFAFVEKKIKKKFSRIYKEIKNFKTKKFPVNGVDLINVDLRKENWKCFD